MATTKKDLTKKQVKEKPVDKKVTKATAKTADKKSVKTTAKIAKHTTNKTAKVEKETAQFVVKTETAAKKPEKVPNTRRRIVVNYNQLSQELIDLLNEKYPLGWRNFIIKADKGNGSFFHAIMLDTEDVSYLIKVEVKVDSEITEDVEKDLFGGLADDDFIGDDDADDDFNEKMTTKHYNKHD